MGRTLFILLLTIIHASLIVNSVIAVNLKKGFSLKMIHREEERLQRLFEQSKSQARYIQSQILLQSNATHSVNPEAARSDQTWLQCEDATEVFAQDMPLYPWSSSTTYRPVPCNMHPLCKGYKCNVDGQCTYVTRYAAGAVTSGVVAEEKFTLGSSTGSGEWSFINQLGAAGQGNKRVGFPRGTFELNSQGKGDTLVDSGAPISMMFKDHFDRVADLVKAHFNNLVVEYVGRHEYFDVCFRLRGKFNITNYPSITLHFQQANYVISDYKSNFIVFNDIVCLGI
ncbi:uncharacterized protein LOC113311298 [Papaver somniferum]|uniref:uncharacterized protein LOC113311298 n=1 Tax=Papaver somniferum TaxID=3469 RepID=UPI000E7012DF|nr:uncharacterized protein LOC113311298 [Papaver somniferum]